ncbi:hypothetical protein HJB99_07915 [Rhizobium sp. NLR17b]|uniref:hypothetical protein n=1 Tax=Rhizobium sp. NLR17b TaxID=2731114 RepID=UPI001C83B730|nr:hypothetical protein [Rhizobium sp. NLR17b]MBX5268604.1 hypothetical protein [Rhizobium sp. NLR17b]
MIPVSEIHDAVEVAAGASTASGIEILKPRTPSDDKIAHTRRVVRLFLENVDGGLTVEERLEALDEGDRE